MAVVAVLLFHGGVGWARGGFLGVDVFFVLSGYLITTLLLREWEADGAIALRAFWARRARRLLPALFALVATIGLYARWFAPADTLPSLRFDALATLAYVANWRFVVSGGSYFARAALPSPLLHAWSLGIEEQFYLAWPLVVVAVLRRRSHQTLLRLTAGAVAFSAVEMALLYRAADSSRVYYGTDTRAQSVLVGALLALVLAALQPRNRDRARSDQGRVALEVAAAVGAAIVVAACVRLDGSSTLLYRGGFLVVCAATALVVADIVLVGDGIVARALSWAPLTVLGRISYGLYLWHWPLFLVLDHERTGLQGPLLLGLRLVATLTVAVLSYRFVELPIRRGALPQWRARVALPTAMATTTAVVLVATTASTVALPTTSAASRRPVSAPLPTPAQVVPSAAPSVVRHRSAGQPARVLFVGDSVALTLAQGLPVHDHRYDTDISNDATLGCGVVRGGPFRYFGSVKPALPQCEVWPATWRSDILRDDPDVVAVVLGRWEVMDRVHDGTWTRIGDPAFDRYLESELETTLPILSARGARVALCTAPYYHRGERPDGGSWPEDDPARVDRWNDLVRDVAGRHPGQVTLVDLGGVLSPGHRLARTIDGVQVRSSDGVHITPAGARWLEPWLLPQLTALAPPPS